VVGRERYPINVRYLQDYRNNLDALRRVLLDDGRQGRRFVGEVADIELGPGPSMIRDEDGQLTGYVYIDLSGSDYGRLLDRAHTSSRSS